MKQEGFSSAAYLGRLIDDQQTQGEEDKEMFSHIMDKLQVNDKIYEVSFETYVGDETVIDLKFVKAYMELISYHPIK
jgi:hypothetical protein